MQGALTLYLTIKNENFPLSLKNLFNSDFGLAFSFPLIRKRILHIRIIENLLKF